MVRNQGHGGWRLGKVGEGWHWGMQGGRGANVEKAARSGARSGKKLKIWQQ